MNLWSHQFSKIATKILQGFSPWNWYWPVFSALKSTVVQYFSKPFTWNLTVKNHDCLFSCLQNYGYSIFFMYTVFFHVLQYFFMYKVFFPVYMIFSCLHDFFMFAAFFANINTICQTFHSNLLLCYRLLLSYLIKHCSRVVKTVSWNKAI